MSDDRKIVIGVEVDATGASTGFDRVEQSAVSMAQKVSTAGEKAGKAIDGIGTSTEKLNATQSRVLESIKRTTIGTTEGKAALLEYRAGIAGVTDAASPYIAKLKQAEQGQVQLGMSAKATSAALRGVPAQMTDIITSLQGGQKPLSVFLQQGGQLKDMFGGAGNAAKALGGYVFGLINPLSLTAGALGVVGFALSEGSSELRAFQKEAIITGNAIGVSASQFAALRDSVGGIATKGKAAEVLTEIAASGKIAGGEIKGIAEAAILMEKATGQATAKTIAQFAELAKSPAEAAAKLNEQYNFLTTAVFKQIKALEEQGRATQAAELAEKSFADALKARATSVLESAGFIEKAWRGVTGAAKGAWDAMLNVGRSLSPAEKAGAAAADVARIQAQLEGVGAFGSTGGGAATGGASAARKAALEQELSGAKQLLAEASRRVEIEQRNTAEKAEQNRLEQLGISFTKQSDEFLTKQQRMEREVTKARVEGQELVRAGLITQVELTQRISNIREKFKETGTGKGPRIAANAFDMEELRQYAKALEDFAKIEGDAAAKAEDLSKSQAKLREVQASPTWAAYSRQQQEQIIYAAALAQAEEDRAAATAAGAKAAREAAAEYAKYLQTQFVLADKLRDEAKNEAERTAAIGLSKEAVAELAAAKLDAAAATKEKTAAEEEERDGNLELAALYKDQAKSLRDRAAAMRAGGAKEAAEDARKDWEKTADSINNSLTDALLRGFESGKGFAENMRDTLVNMFKTMVLRPIIQGVMAPVSGAISQGISGILGGQQGGGNGMLGMAQNAYSLYSNGTSGLTAPGSMYYNVATSGFGQSVGLSNAAPIIGNNVSAYAPAGTQLSGSAAGGSAAGGAAAAAGAALAVAAIALAFMEAVNSTKGEQRGGAQYGYSFDGLTVANPRRGASVAAQGIGATFLEGPDGGDPMADANKKLINSTVASIGAAFKTLGVDATLTGYQAAYETSTMGRGGVFAGGTLSNGKTFGESGTGTSTDPATPLESLYEMWGANGKVMGDTGFIPDLNGTPEKLLVDAQQSYLEAIQASVGIIPKVIAETYKAPREVSDGGGAAEGGNSSLQIVDATRYIRVYDAAAKESVRTLGLLPKKIADLILEVDPEALSAEATAALTTKVTTLIANVQGFRTLVDLLPVKQLRDASFDIAAGLVELSGGFDQFAANLGTYVDNFYSDIEKRSIAAANIATRLNAADVNNADGSDLTASNILDLSRESFRGMVEALDLTTDSGQKSYAALLSVAGAFASISDSANSATDALNAERAANQATYDANFLSPQEQARKTAQGIADSLNKSLGTDINVDQVLGATRQSFRAFVDTLDDTTEQGRKVKDAMLSVAGSFASITDKADAAAAAMQSGYIFANQGDIAEANYNAAQAQLSAAQAVRNAWLETMKSIEDAQKELRGELSGNKARTFAGAQSQFSIATAQARAGDKAAADSLPALAKTLQELALGQASTRLDYSTIVAATIASLELTNGTIRPRAGLPAFDVGTPEIMRTGQAIVHQGEAILPAAAAQRWRDTGGNQELVAAVERLEGRLAEIEKNTGTTARSTGRTDQEFQRLSREGFSVVNLTGTTLETV